MLFIPASKRALLIPNKPALVMATSLATFVAANTIAAQPSQANLHFPTSGVQAGDLLVAFTNNATSHGLGLTLNNGGVSPRAMLTTGLNDSYVSTGEVVCLFYIVLNAGDIADGTITTTGSTVSGAVVNFLVYRGPTSIAERVVSTDAVSDTFINLGPITPAANTAGIVAWLSVTRQNALPTSYAGRGVAWAQRINNIDVNSYDTNSVFDILSGYVPGTDTFSPIGNTGYLPEPFGVSAELLI
jgi:hypothetical protein